MFKDQNLQDMIMLARKSAEQLNSEIVIFDKILDSTLKNAPEEDKRELEEVKALATKAVNLAKMGKAEEAQNIITQFKNGRKST